MGSVKIRKKLHEIDKRVTYNKEQSTLFNFDDDFKFCSNCGEQMTNTLNTYKTKKGLVCRDCLISIRGCTYY
jgi:NADH pyrophosphatase NudC (nudix superfamily)